MQREGDITFFEDIVKEMSEELGIGRQELTELIENNFRYTKELAKDPEVTSIKLGKNLGKMVANSYMMVTQMNNDSKNTASNNRQKHVEKTLRPRLKKINEFLSKMQYKFEDTIYNRKPFLYMLKDPVQKILKQLVKPYKNKRIIWETLSSHQNSINNDNTD